MPYTYLQLLGYLSHYNKPAFTAEPETSSKRRKTNCEIERRHCQLKVFHAKTKQGRTLAVFKCTGPKRGGNLNGRNPPCGSPGCRVCSRLIGQCVPPLEVDYVFDEYSDLWIKDCERECPTLSANGTGLRSLPQRSKDAGTRKTLTCIERVGGEDGAMGQASRRRRLRLVVREPEATGGQ